MRWSRSTTNEPVHHAPLERLARAMLLFHSAGPWVREKEAEWLTLTGTREATTKSLCDLARLLPPNLTCPPCAQERRRQAYARQKGELARQFNMALLGLPAGGTGVVGESYTQPPPAPPAES